ncbi:MAG: hypothetical protein QM793_06780 [Muricomes sp.]
MYVTRKLSIGDLMPVVRIVGKIGIADFKKCFSGDNVANMIQDGKSEKNTDAILDRIGFEAVINAADVLLINFPKCERELYEFLSSMCEISVEDFKKLPPSALLEVVHEVFAAEEAKDFFTHVTRLLNLEKSDSGTSSTQGTRLLTD